MYASNVEECYLQYLRKKGLLSIPIYIGDDFNTLNAALFFKKKKSSLTEFQFHTKVTDKGQ